MKDTHVLRHEPRWDGGLATFGRASFWHEHTPGEAHQFCSINPRPISTGPSRLCAQSDTCRARTKCDRVGVAFDITRKLLRQVRENRAREHRGLTLRPTTS